MPEISVIMNCYNGESYLREAIDSVFAQTFQDLELIFWDNCSTDGSAEIARSYTDSRFRYFRGEHNVPLGAARKLAMEQVRGKWIGFLDTDDFWLPQKLATQIAEIDGEDYVLCYAGIREIDGTGRIIREAIPIHSSGEMFEAQLRHFDINMITPLLRRQALIDFGLNFDANLVASEEFNLFMRLLARGRGCAIPKVLGCWRVTQGTLTSRSMQNWADERFYTLRQVEQENPGITSRFPSAFAAATARGHYYRARWHMHSGEPQLARAALRQAAAAGFIYRVFSWLTFSRTAWNCIHTENLKRRLSGFLRTA